MRLRVSSRVYSYAYSQATPTRLMRYNFQQWRSTHSQERHHGPTFNRSTTTSSCPRPCCAYAASAFRHDAHAGASHLSAAALAAHWLPPKSSSGNDFDSPLPRKPVRASTCSTKCLSLSLSSLSLSSPSLLLLHDRTCYTTNTYQFLLGRHTLAKYMVQNPNTTACPHMSEVSRKPLTMATA